MSRMNAGIILAGQNPDFLGTIDRANTAAARQNQFQQQNALNGVYQQHGQGIAAGDQNALNALAGVDPMAALGVQQKRQNMQINQQELELRKQDAARKSQSWAMQLDSQTAAVHQQKIKAGLLAAGQAHASGNLGEVNRILQASDVPPLNSLDEFPFLAAQYEGVLTSLDQAAQFGKPDVYKPQSAPGKVSADIAAGVLPEGTPLRTNGETIRTNPDGSVEITRGGGGAAPPKLTVDAAKNSGFLLRTQEANQVLNDLEGQGTRFGQQALDAIPLGAGNYLRDPDFQRFDQARRDFVNAILRRESGAVISDQEFDNANKQYFPVPGDGPEVIAQKQRNRETAIEGLRVGSGAGAAYVDQLNAQPEEQANSFDPQTPDFSQMSDEELQAYIERGGK